MDYSELLMYRNVIYREMGDLDRALADLRENRFDFTDKALVSQIEGMCTCAPRLRWFGVSSGRPFCVLLMHHSGTFD